MVLGLWFESVRVMFPLFYYFKRASRSHAKTGFRLHEPLEAGGEETPAFHASS